MNDQDRHDTFDAPGAGKALYYLHYTALVPNPANPRREIVVDDAFRAMAESVHEHGVVEPLICVPLPDQDDSAGNVMSMIICGHIRRRVVEYLVETGQILPNHPHCYLPVVLEPDMAPDRQLALMFVENEHRIPVNPVDEGLFYLSLVEQGWTKAKIAHRLEVSLPRLDNRMTIAGFPDEVRAMYRDGRLPLWSAGPLHSITDPGDRQRLAQMLAGKNLTLERIRTISAQVAEIGIDALLNKGHNGQSGGNGAGPGRPARAEKQRLVSGQVVGLAALRTAVASTCSACDVAPSLALPESIQANQVNGADKAVCDACSVRDLATACSLCPLVQFLDLLAKQVGTGNVTRSRKHGR